MYGQPPFDGSFPSDRPGQPRWSASRPPHPSPYAGVTPGRRASAWAIDFGISLVVFGTLAYLSYLHIRRAIPHLAIHAVQDIIVSRGDVIGAAMNAWDEVVSYLYQVLLIFVVIQFGHQFAGLVWKGRTVGKAVLGIRVLPQSMVQARSLPTPGQAARRAAVTTFTESGLYALSLALLLSGAGPMAILVWLASIFAIAANGLTALMAPQHQSLSDRLAGTLVIPADRRLFSPVSAAAASPWAGARTPLPLTPYAQPLSPPVSPPAPRPRTQQPPTPYQYLPPPYPPYPPYPPSGPPYAQHQTEPGHHAAHPPGSLPPAGTRPVPPIALFGRPPVDSPEGPRPHP